MSELFDDVIDSYGEEQAIEDGALFYRTLTGFLACSSRSACRLRVVASTAELMTNACCRC